MNFASPCSQLQADAKSLPTLFNPLPPTTLLWWRHCFALKAKHREFKSNLTFSRYGSRRVKFTNLNVKVKAKYREMIFVVLKLKFDEDKACSLSSQILTKSAKKRSRDKPPQGKFTAALSALQIPPAPPARQKTPSRSDVRVRNF